MSWKSLFLVIAAVGIFQLSTTRAVILVGGYYVFAQLDYWLAAKARTTAIANELDGWEIEPDDPEYESKNNVVRVRLGQKDQVVVARIAELLRKTAN